VGAFVDTYVDSQESFDSSVRLLAAGGLGLTVTLATALKELDGVGLAAVLAFLVSLGANFASYSTAQKDMLMRLAFLDGDDNSAGDEWGNRWTRWTTGLNYTAGVTLLLGGLFLACFVWTTEKEKPMRDHDQQRSEEQIDALTGAATPPPRVLASRAKTPPPRMMASKPIVAREEKGQTPPPKASPQPKKP
jgi:hypothetical protein